MELIQLIPNFINYSNDPFIMEGFDCNGNCQDNFYSVILVTKILMEMGGMEIY